MLNVNNCVWSTKYWVEKQLEVWITKGQILIEHKALRMVCYDIKQ